MMREDLERVIAKDEDLAYVELRKSGKSNSAAGLKNFYISLLENESELVRAGALYALLYCLKYRDHEVRAKALSYLYSPPVEDELEQAAISGLGQAYGGSKGAEVLKGLYEVYLSHRDRYMSSYAFNSLLYVYGLKSTEVFARIGYADKIGDSHAAAFKNELSEVKVIAYG